MIRTSAAAMLFVPTTFLLSGCHFVWEREQFYDVKSVNIDSTTTPGATVSLAEHKAIVESARSDVTRAGVRFLLLSGVATVWLMTASVRQIASAVPEPRPPSRRPRAGSQKDVAGRSWSGWHGHVPMPVS